MSHAIVPVVGMGVTGGCGSDCYPYTIVEVISPKEVAISADDYKRTDNNGFSESQTYEYTTNWNEKNPKHITLRKNGWWILKGEPMHGGTHFYVGQRRAYQDPSF